MGGAAASVPTQTAPRWPRARPAPHPAAPALPPRVAPLLPPTPAERAPCACAPSRYNSTSTPADPARSHNGTPDARSASRSASATQAASPRGPPASETDESGRVSGAAAGPPHPLGVLVASSRPATYL